MAAEVGSAYFTLLPSVKGLQGAIGKEVAGLNGQAEGAKVGRSLGGGIAGGVKALVGPAIALAAGVGIKNFLGEAIEGVKGWQVLQAQTEAVVKSTGGSANITAKQLHELVESTEGLTATQGETIQQGANMLLTFTNIRNEAGKGNDIFNQATKTMVDYSRATGTDAKSAAVQLGKALNDPIKGISALGKAGVQFTADQKEQIKTMVEAGDTLGAQKIILKELNTQFGGSGAAYAKTTAGQLYLLGDAYGDLGEGIVRGFMPAVGAAAGAGGKLLGAITPAVEGFSAKAGEMVVKLFDLGPRIKQGWDGVISIFRDGDFTTAFREAFNVEEDSPIVGALFTIREKVQTGLQGIRDFVTGFTIPMNFLEDAGVDTSGLVGVGAAIREAFDGIWQAVQPLIPQILELWSSFSPLSLVFQAIAPVLPVLAVAIAQLASALGGALAGALSAAMPALQSLASVLVGALGTVFAAVAPVIVSLLGQMGGLFTQLGPVIGTIVGILATLVAQLVSAVMPIFLQLVTAVMPMVVQIFFAVMQAIVPLVTMIAGLLIPIIQALLPVVVMVFSVVAQVIQAAMQIVMGIIQVVTGIISGNWGMVWNGIKNVASGIWNAIVALVRGALAILGSIVIAGVTIVANFIRAGFEGARNFISSIWNGIISFIGGAISNVRSVIVGGIGAAANFIRSGFQGAANFLGGVWSNIVNGVSGMIGRVTGFFTGLPGRILGALGNVGGTLLQAGKDIVQGLINGIGSMMGSIGRAVLNIVPAAIRGPFEKLMGIQSPSRVAIWWGQMIGDGLTGGIEGSAGKVAGAVRKMVPGPPEVTRALAYAGSRTAYDVASGGSSGGTVVEQHIYPSEGMSETNLANIVGRKLERAGK